MTIDHKKDVIKALEKITATGYSQRDIFEDFLNMVYATLEALPGHLAAIKKKEKFEDTPETSDLFQKMHQKYKDYYWPHFQAAFHALIESTDEFQDLLGDVYMEFAHPNKWTGQFFTPYHICQVMVRLTFGDIERQVMDRIKDACMGNPFAEAILLTSVVIEDQAESEKWFFDRLLPVVAADVDPITVCDCCCGSGAMLLAGAECCPTWALQFGFIRFYGQDIDQTCVTMARVNLMLYGLNGYGIKCVNALSEAEMNIIPEPWQGKYRAAQEAEKNGDQNLVNDIQEEMRSWKQNKLF